MGTLDAQKEQLWQVIEQQRDRWVQLCQNLVRIPSENPPGPTTAIAAHVKRLLEAAGLPVEWVEPRAGDVSLLSRQGSGDGPFLLLNGHLDVFPADPDDGWDYPPFAGDVVDGHIRGRGVADMKAGTAAALATFLLMKELGIPISGKLGLMLVGDEETGGLYGTDWLLRNRPEWVPDVVLIGEPCGTDAIRIGEKGIAWIRVSAEGAPMHGALGVGDNAILRIARAVVALREVTSLRGSIPPALEPIIRASQAHGWNVHARDRMWLLEAPSYGPGVIGGGIKTNVAPRTAFVDLDIRLPFGITRQQLLTWVTERLTAEGLTDLKVAMVPHSSEANVTDPAHPMIRSVSQNATRVLGREPVLVISPAATDGRHFRARNVPTIIYGPEAINMAAANEKIRVVDYLTTLKVHSASVLDFFAGAWRA